MKIYIFIKHWEIIILKEGWLGKMSRSNLDPTWRTLEDLLLIVFYSSVSKKPMCLAIILNNAWCFNLILRMSNIVDFHLFGKLLPAWNWLFLFESNRSPFLSKKSNGSYVLVFFLRVSMLASPSTIQKRSYWTFHFWLIIRWMREIWLRIIEISSFLQGFVAINPVESSP